MLPVYGMACVLDEPYTGVPVWREYVPAALEKGILQAKPDAQIIQGGLGKIQQAMDLLKAGVSAKKIVVEL